MDQVVVVTGAGSGIGRATACLFAERGYQVLAVGRREAPLAETAQLGAHLAGGIVPFSADVSDEAAVTRMTAEACELGRVSASASCVPGPPSGTCQPHKSDRRPRY
ncbi:MAG: SDR family NAD(P)-dependent oxidoreductase [Proteobacteria bacterium]|nr:SDR family NAD(P)-dependent oxidoreductase [Pseudomonadota bacterium]